MSAIDIGALGSGGLGLVWGWLVGKLPGHIQKPFRSATAVVIATAAIVAGVLWLSDWTAVGIFLAAGLLSFVVHLAWRQSLTARE